VYNADRQNAKHLGSRGRIDLDAVYRARGPHSDGMLL